jgi:hypothetical protein
MVAVKPDDAKTIARRRALVEKELRALARKGVISWAGGKPRGSRPRVRLATARPVSDYVIEDRR